MEQEKNQAALNYQGKLEPESFTTRGPSQGEHTEAVRWQASEFIDHQKSTVWFLLLVVGTMVLSGVVYLLTRDILATLVMIVAAVAFGLFARQKPRTLEYSVSSSAIKIGQRTYQYDEFRSFSVMQDGALFSIVLEPVKRFMPPLTIYFSEQDGEKIFDTLSQHLPHQERSLDFVDQIMKKIRF